MGAANETLGLSGKDPAGNVAAVSIAVPFRKVPRNGCCDLFAECLMALCAMPTNADALSRLLITDRAPLLRWVARIVGAGPAAEDVAQSLWLRVQRVADDPPITHKRAYLYRLASNLALDHGKREARLQSVHEEAQALLWGSDQALAADRTILARDTLKRIEAGIEGLPLQTRRVFELHRYEHMTQRVVAEKLGISTTAVEKHMRRAMMVISACRDADD